MEYTDVEKQVLSLIKKADFRNIPNSNVLSYASKLNELRPECCPSNYKHHHQAF